MPYFLFGLLALLLAMLTLHALARANTAALARNVRVGTGIVALGGAAFLLVRGAASYALPLAAFASWLLLGQPGRRWPSSPHRGPANGTSRVVTEHLDMELDLTSGTMQGRILKGSFEGRDLASLRPAELASLWREWRFTDPQSAQLVEAWLDRTHPTWREDMEREGKSETRGERASTRMSFEEALELLGLDAGASAEDVRHAHRELMLKLHPDRGGSTYLASRINEARDVAMARLDAD